MNLIKKLPNDICCIILKYVGYPRDPIYYLIKEELSMYNIDHSIYHSMLTKKYFIQDILLFSEYYFDKFKNPAGYLRKWEDPY
jgi:hypothetical protein